MATKIGVEGGPVIPTLALGKDVFSDIPHVNGKAAAAVIEAEGLQKVICLSWRSEAVVLSPLERDLRESCEGDPLTRKLVLACWSGATWPAYPWGNEQVDLISAHGE